MEMALQTQTEELNRSRSDYTALFQNFKQSRIIFEGRELASKATLQKVLGDNKALDGVLKQVTEELKLCRSRFTDLQKSFENANTVAEAQNQTNRAQIQRATDQYNTAKNKLRAQKCIIKEQRATQRDFEADLQKIEQSTNLFKIRDETLSARYDTIATINSDLREELKAKASIVMKQAADIVRLNSLIADEMISKYDYHHMLSENDDLKKKISEETVSLVAHRQLKGKYENLLQHTEQRIVPSEDQGVVVPECHPSASASAEKEEYVTSLTTEALQLNCQAANDETCDVNETVKILQDAKSSDLGAVSESEERCTTLHVLLEEARADLSAYKQREELRCEMDARREALEKNLAAQRTILAINDVRKEKRAIDDLEQQVKSLEKELQDEKDFRSRQLELLAMEHSSEMIDMRKSIRKEMEEEKVSIGKDILRIHGIEVQGLHDSYNLQLAFLSPKTIELKGANEEYVVREKSLLAQTPDKNSSPLKVQDPSDNTGRNRIEVVHDNKYIRNLTDDHSNDMLVMEEKNEILNSEITALKGALEESLKGLKTEMNRADLISSDYSRIEMDLKNAILCAQEANSRELLHREKYKNDDLKQKEYIEMMEIKIQQNGKLCKKMKSETIEINCENEELREVAANLEMDCSNLRRQLEDVKEAVLESMTLTLPRNQVQGPSSSLDFLKHRNLSDAPSTTATTTASATSTRALTSTSIMNKNDVKKSVKGATRIPRPKVPNERTVKPQDQYVTPIQAALNRKQAFAAAAAAVLNAVRPVHPPLKQRESLKGAIPKRKNIRTKKPSSPGKGPVEPVRTLGDLHDVTATMTPNLDFIDSNPSCRFEELVVDDLPSAPSNSLSDPLRVREEAGHKVRACSTYPIGPYGAGSALPLPLSTEDSGAGWADRMSLPSPQSTPFQAETGVVPLPIAVVVPAGTGTEGGTGVGVGVGGVVGGGGVAILEGAGEETNLEANTELSEGYSTAYPPVGLVYTDNWSPRDTHTSPAVHSILSPSLLQPPVPYSTDKDPASLPLTVGPSSLELMDRLIQSSKVQGPFLTRNTSLE